VATLAGAAVEERTLVLEDVPDDMRSVLVGAHEGGLLGPVAAENGTLVLVVKARVAPTLDDDCIRRRAEATIVSAALHRLETTKVRWDVRL
jgi:hypothetical protein